MPRGGRRAGTPGKSYGNRTDLNQQRTMPVARIPNQKRYGDQAAQVAAQRALPVATAPRPQSPAVVAGGSAPVGPVPAPQAGGGDPFAGLPPLGAPTQRPGEPLTSGIDMGAGPGSEVLAPNPADDPTVAELRALYRRFPNEDLRELLEDIDTGRTF